MDEKITIGAAFRAFYVATEPDGTVIAEFSRYADALAAAHLLAREMGWKVEEQPPELTGGRSND